MFRYQPEKMSAKRFVARVMGPEIEEEENASKRQRTPTGGARRLTMQENSDRWSSPTTERQTVWK